MLRRLLDRLLAAALDAPDRDALIGDLTHEYDTRVRPTRGRLRADWWYARQIAAALAYAWRDRLRAHDAAPGASSRTSSSWSSWSSSRADVRGAVRGVWRAPAFTAVA
jgi:hypothetical protein